MLQTIIEQQKNALSGIMETEIIEEFSELFTTFMNNKDEFIDWNKISDFHNIHHYNDLDDVQINNLSDKLAVVKLNGGLGTSMGCTEPKSLIQVKNNKTFLDITIKQLSKYNIPLILMNSFNTDDQIEKILPRYNNITIHTFNQSKYPRINNDNYLPITDNIWYPPGHGDFFKSIYKSGLLHQLLEQGKEYIFLSNIDNLAATVDFKILNFMIQNNNDFIMEVTDKTLADVKGGTLINYEDKIKLLEIAQVPDNYIDEFKSIKKFKIFNTNNIWMNISSIIHLIESNEMKINEIIPNKKNINGKKIIQLETAIGTYISNFKNSTAINVPRSRFLPVKSTNDLMLLRSNMYLFSDDFHIIVNPERPFNSVPIIKLGPCFRDISDYEKRIKGDLDLLEIDRLTINGDVYLGSEVKLKGTVIIIALNNKVINIPDNSVLENNIVTGHLNILDHN